MIDLQDRSRENQVDRIIRAALQRRIESLCAGPSRCFRVESLRTLILKAHSISSSIEIGERWRKVVRSVAIAEEQKIRWPSRKFCSPSPRAAGQASGYLRLPFRRLKLHAYRYTRERASTVKITISCSCQVVSLVYHIAVRRTEFRSAVNRSIHGTRCLYR